MERSAYQKLADWKNNYRRKPLIINGARQVGKTWLLKNSDRGNMIMLRIFPVTIIL